MGLLFREHPKAQPGGGFWRSPGSNLRPLAYRRLFLRLFCGFVVPGAPEGSTRRRFFGEARDRTCDPWPFTPLIEFFGTYKMFKILIQPDVGTSYLSKILLLYGAKANKTSV